MQSFQRPCLFRGGPRQILSQIVQTRSSPEETACFPSIPAKREEKKDILKFEDIEINKKTREVTSEGHLCELTLKEFELLVYLMENQSRVVTRDELLNQVWGYEYDGETRTLDMHIRTLRQKLGEKGSYCIKTVRGVGYRLVHQEG